MALRQTIQQKQQLKLLPQQIQLMKLLQVPTDQLEERIKEELEENPALELVNEDDFRAEDNGIDAQEINDNLHETEEGADTEGNENLTETEAVALDDYDDDFADYRTRADDWSGAEEKQPLPFKATQNFHDILLSQLGMLSFNTHQRQVAEQIIGSLDDDGYLRREIPSIVDDLAFRQSLITNEAEVESILKQIQQFDPPGIGARDLRECLLLQLQHQQRQGKDMRVAIELLREYFEEFTKKHYERICRGMGISQEELREVINQITRLNPRPGSSVDLSNGAENYVIPDFFIFNNMGKLELTLNSKNAPDLRISHDYRHMLRNYEVAGKSDKRQKEAAQFLKQKIESARWFIDIIRQRQETLFNTMHAIMEFQMEFFLTGDETSMRPMILKDISEKTGLDISTISRVANSKFVQTEFGVYRLKFFFSESLTTESGEEVSTREVRKILSDLVADEDKKSPISDDALTAILREKGYMIARRTVAKYREQMNIPVARLRREL